MSARPAMTDHATAAGLLVEPVDFGDGEFTTAPLNVSSVRNLTPAP